MTDRETKITVTGLNGITDSGSGVASIKVLHSTSSSSAGATETAVAVGANSVVLTGLAPATTYYVWTQATDNANNVAGPTAIAGGGTVSTLDETAPTGLGGVAAALGPDPKSQIVLSNLGGIVDNVGVTNFWVLYSQTNDALGAAVANAGTTALSDGTFTLTGLAGGTKYYLWTQASDAAGNTAGPTAVAGGSVTTASSRPPSESTPSAYTGAFQTAGDVVALSDFPNFTAARAAVAAATWSTAFWLYASPSSTTTAVPFYFRLKQMANGTTLYVANNYLVFVAYSLNSSIEWQLDNRTFPLGTWIHIAFVVNNGNGLLYVNKAVAVDKRGASYTMNGFFGTTNDTDYQLGWGARAQTGTPATFPINVDLPLNGYMDNLVFWTSAMSAQDVVDHYNLGHRAA